MQADLRDFQKRSLYPVFQPAQVTPGQQHSFFFFQLVLVSLVSTVPLQSRLKKRSSRSSLSMQFSSNHCYLTRQLLILLPKFLQKQLRTQQMMCKAESLPTFKICWHSSDLLHSYLSNRKQTQDDWFWFFLITSNKNLLLYIDFQATEFMSLTYHFFIPPHFQRVA